MNSYAVSFNDFLIQSLIHFKTHDFLIIPVTKLDLEGAIKFDVNWSLYHEHLETPESVMNNATNAHVVLEAENNVKTWMISMEHVGIETRIVVAAFCTR